MRLTTTEMVSELIPYTKMIGMCVFIHHSQEGRAKDTVPYTSVKLINHPVSRFLYVYSNHRRKSTATATDRPLPSLCDHDHDISRR